MRIAQVCPYDIDRPGGVQRHILDTAVALSELGHEVVVIAPRTSVPATENSGIAIHRIGKAIRLGLFGTGFEVSIALGRERKALATLMRDGGFDIAHFHTPWTPFLAPQALSGFSGPAAVTFHDTPSPALSGRLLAWLFRRLSRVLLPRFDLVLTPSDSPKDHLVTGAGQEIVVFPPCTDLRPFAAAAPQARFRDERINILFLGRLEPRKGAMLALMAYHRLRNSGLKLRLIMAGAGEQESALRAYVRDHGVAHVEFLGAPSETASLFASADIFCAPSPYGESFGIVLAEAMAAGKPVVAAANAGYRTLLTGEAADFLVPPGSVEALAAAIETLARDEALRRRLGAWGREAARRYDCRRLAPNLVTLYHEAIRRHQIRARSAI